jgi:hypothetical protein
MRSAVLLRPCKSVTISRLQLHSVLCIPVCTELSIQVYKLSLGLFWFQYVWTAVYCRRRSLTRWCGLTGDRLLQFARPWFATCAVYAGVNATSSTWVTWRVLYCFGITSDVSLEACSMWQWGSNFHSSSQHGNRLNYKMRHMNTVLLPVAPQTAYSIILAVKVSAYCNNCCLNLPRAY